MAHSFYAVLEDSCAFGLPAVAMEGKVLGIDLDKQQGHYAVSPGGVCHDKHLTAWRHGQHLTPGVPNHAQVRLCWRLAGKLLSNDGHAYSLIFL